LIYVSIFVAATPVDAGVLVRSDALHKSIYYLKKNIVTKNTNPVTVPKTVAFSSVVVENVGAGTNSDGLDHKKYFLF